MSDKIREAFKVAADAAGIKDGTDRLALWAWWLKAWQAALAQQPATTVPDGWKLVPIRATREQVNAVCMHPDLARTLYRNMVEAAPAPAPAAPAPEPEPQEPVAFYWQDLDAFPLTARRHGPYFGWPSEDAIARCQHYAKPIPLYAAPPADEQPYSATSDRYRAELYDEVWSQARLIGFGNVTDALAELQRMKLAEQPDAVKAPRELLERLVDVCADAGAGGARKELRALLGKEGE